jgi:hypothetical protein
VILLPHIHHGRFWIQVSAVSRSPPRGRKYSLMPHLRSYSPVLVTLRRAGNLARCQGLRGRGSHGLLPTRERIPSLLCFPRSVMTHKYRGCIVVLLINKSVKPNEEQKVLTSGFDQGFTINTSKRVFRGIW